MSANKLKLIPLLEEATNETSVLVAKYTTFKNLMRDIYLNNSKSKAFDEIAKAAERKQIVSITYVEQIKNTHTKIKQYRRIYNREIEVYSIRRHYNVVQHRSYYYLYAYSAYPPAGIRSYRIDRIESAILLKRQYSPRWILELSQAFFDDIRKSLGLQVTKPEEQQSTQQQKPNAPQQTNTTTTPQQQNTNTATNKAPEQPKQPPSTTRTITGSSQTQITPEK